MIACRTITDTGFRCVNDDGTVTLTDYAGQATGVDTPTPLESEWLAAWRVQANRDALTARAQQALTGNATFLANASPTAAQVAAQVKALTRQVNALIRMSLAQFDDTTGT